MNKPLKVSTPAASLHTQIMHFIASETNRGRPIDAVSLRSDRWEMWLSEIYKRWPELVKDMEAVKEHGQVYVKDIRFEKAPVTQIHRVWFQYRVLVYDEIHKAKRRLELEKAIDKSR